MSESQERYLAHQERKKKALMEIMLERHSQRAFSEESPSVETIMELLSAMRTCPSSCDRKGVRVYALEGRDKKALLGGLLVGGVGWIHRAPVVLLMFANAECYKAEGEIAYMPYLDAGAMMYAAYLHATANGMACCFCNPNIREMNKGHFADIFGEGVFCGAIAIGFPRKSS
jgi:hypothetical protein